MLTFPLGGRSQLDDMCRWDLWGVRLLSENAVNFQFLFFFGWFVLGFFLACASVCLCVHEGERD